MRNRLRPRGFNFTEVLFAVMILGVGFIMVAAIFPVALTQTKATGEEVVASTVARGGVNYLKQVGISLAAYSLPATDLQTTPPRRTTPPLVLPVEPVPANGQLYMPGKMVSFRDNRFEPAIRDFIWRQVSGNLILPDDPRVAWVGFYRRGTTFVNTSGGALPADDPGIRINPDPHAHVVIIGVNARARSAFDAGKDLKRYPTDVPPPPATTPPGSLEGRVVHVKLTEGNLGPDLLSFYVGQTAAAARYEEIAAAEGTYIVISDDQIPDNPATPAVNEYNERNGRVYRLGTKRDDLGIGVWELAPDGDLTFVNPDGTVGNADDVSENIPPRPVSTNSPLTAADYAPAGGLPAIAFMVGRAYADPTDPTAGFEGIAQDTGVYVSIIPAN